MTVVKVQPQRLLTIEQVALRLGVSRSTVYRLIQGRDLTAIRVLGSRRVSSREVDRYIRALTLKAQSLVGAPGYEQRRRGRVRHRGSGPLAEDRAGAQR